MNLTKWCLPGTLAALSLASTLALGLPDDRNQPIHIEADSAVRDQLSGITTYTGNVEMDQGSIHISADKILIYTQDQKVSKIIATGIPAHFQQKPSAEKEIILARGNTLIYEVVQDKLSITENAQVEQDGSIVSGDLINYDIHLALVEAGSRDNKSRVKIVLQPQNKNSDQKE